MLAEGRVGVAPATITMYVPPNGAPTLMGPYEHEGDPRGMYNGRPISPGVPALPSQWQASQYYGYLPVWKGWMTPGLGAGAPMVELLGDYALSGAPAPGLGDSNLVVAAIGSAVISGLLSGIIAYAAFKTSGAKRSWAPALIWGGGTALVGGVTMGLAAHAASRVVRGG